MKRNKAITLEVLLNEVLFSSIKVEDAVDSLLCTISSYFMSWIATPTRVSSGDPTVLLFFRVV